MWQIVGLSPGWVIHTKDYTIGISCFSAKHVAFRTNSKDWFTQNQDNVSKLSNMSIHELLFQWFSTIKIQASCSSTKRTSYYCILCTKCWQFLLIVHCPFRFYIKCIMPSSYSWKKVLLAYYRIITRSIFYNWTGSLYIFKFCLIFVALFADLVRGYKQDKQKLILRLIFLIILLPSSLFLVCDPLYDKQKLK